MAPCCKEKNLTGKATKNQVLETKNVQLSALMLYEDKPISTDNLYVNAQGNRFFIEKLQLLVSDFYLTHRTDTFTEKGNYYLYALNNTQYFIMEVEPGRYSGNYGLSVGLDSVATVYAQLNNLSDRSPLNEANIMRNDSYGYNFLVINGRAIDPSDPQDTIGNIPFSYQIGTYMLARDFSTRINFTLSTDGKAVLAMIAKFKPVLDEVDIVGTPLIVSDVTNSADFSLAQSMAEKLQFELH